MAHRPVLSFAPNGCTRGRVKRETMAGMGMIAKAMDRLPKWAQAILVILGITACVYGIARYGWSFVWRLIFAPEL